MIDDFRRTNGRSEQTILRALQVISLTKELFDYLAMSVVRASVLLCFDDTESDTDSEELLCCRWSSQAGVVWPSQISSTFLSSFACLRLAPR